MSSCGEKYRYHSGGGGEPRPWSHADNLLIRQCIVNRALLDNAAFALGRETWEVVRRGDFLLNILKPAQLRGWYQRISRQELLFRWAAILDKAWNKEWAEKEGFS